MLWAIHASKMSKIYLKDPVNEKENSTILLIFLLNVHRFLYEHMYTQRHSVLFAETNGSGMTDSASVSFPNYHTCFTQL